MSTVRVRKLFTAKLPPLPTKNPSEEKIQISPAKNDVNIVKPQELAQHQCLFLEGTKLQEKKRWKEAWEKFLAATQLPEECEDTNWLARCYYEIAICNENINEPTSDQIAANNFKMAAENYKFDEDQQLNARACFLKAAEHYSQQGQCCLAADVLLASHAISPIQHAMLARYLEDSGDEYREQFRWVNAKNSYALAGKFYREEDMRDDAARCKDLMTQCVAEEKPYVMQATIPENDKILPPVLTTRYRKL